jgi:membrane-bound serine protease (ClpP class)
VLVAMACDEIIMGEDARIGDAGERERQEKTGIKDSQRNAYAEVANSRKTIPADVALKMLDPSIELLAVETEVSREIVRADRLDELRRKKSVGNSRVLSKAGEPGVFTAQEARDLGLVAYVANDREAVAKALSLPPAALEQDLSLAGPALPVRIAIKGPISASSAELLQKLIDTEIDHGANLICLWIDSAGGDAPASINLANYLVQIDAERRRTVAFIPNEARGDAAFLALACDQIVMRPEAVLGGSGAYAMPDGERRATATSVAALAARKHHSSGLAAAMVDPEVEVYRYQRRTDGLVGYFTADEAAQLEDAKDWQRGELITRPGRPFQVTGEQAREFGLANEVVDDFEGFKALYGLEGSLDLVEPGWADFLIDALNSPGVSVFLLLLGAAALYAELQSPGIGLGGLIAALCFLLYFWSAYLGGTAGWLEVLLFVAGIICLTLEVFVLPGFGLFGLAGGALVIGSLILASQTFVLPRNDYQLHQLRNNLFVITGAGIGTVVAAVVIRRYLPHAPMFSNMVLTPPSIEEQSLISERESLARLDHLLGARGLSLTPLLPGGKARIGDELVDVLTDGEFVDRGQPVEVVEVRGNRIVVRGIG